MDEEDAFAPYMEEYGIDPLSPPLNQNQNSSVQQGMFQAHGAGRFRSGSSGTKGFLRRDFISRNQQEFNGDGFRDGE